MFSVYPMSMYLSVCDDCNGTLKAVLDGESIQRKS
jgi:hypothetical protein